jgi:hypothetical protein
MNLTSDPFIAPDKSHTRTLEIHLDGNGVNREFRP